MILRGGKIDENVRDRSVVKRLGRAQNHFGLRQGCGNRMEITSDPVTLRTKHTGLLSVTAALNNLAARGVCPEEIRTVVLLPEETQEQTLRSIEDEIAQMARCAGIAVTGGHTEITRAVTRPVVVTQAVGARRYFDSEKGQAAEIRAGDPILLIGLTGLEGTFLLSEEKEEELCAAFPRAFVDRAKGLQELLLMLPAVEALARSGIRPSAMVNGSEGGILAALWKLSDQTGRGFEVSLPDIPVLQETIEFSEYFKINPYRMESAGCLLAVTQEDPSPVCEELEKQGISAREIGRVTDNRDKILCNGEERQHLSRPEPDALIPILG